MSKSIEISCFTDILCVWAYVSQLRIDELQAEWQGKIHLRHHFISVFGCTTQRIGEGWKERGGYDAFGKHVMQVAEQFKSEDVDRSHPATHIWCSKAVQFVYGGRGESYGRKVRVVG